MEASRPDPATAAQAAPPASVAGFRPASRTGSQRVTGLAAGSATGLVSRLVSRLALGFGAVALLLLALAGVAWLALQATPAQLAPYRFTLIGLLIGLTVLGLGGLLALGLTVHRSLTETFNAHLNAELNAQLDARVHLRSQTSTGADLATLASGPGTRLGGARAAGTPAGAPAVTPATAGLPGAGAEPIDDELVRLQRSVAAMQEQLRSVVKSVRIGAVEPATAPSSAAPSVAADAAAAKSSTTQAAATPGAGAQVQLTTWTPASLMAPELDSSAGRGADVSLQLQQAVEAARRGGEVVSQVVGHLDEITSASRRIVDIVATIDNITFQTNLLALNAALEAAGSGGGSVVGVAAEVRTLADRAATAAREIKGLVGDALHKIESGSQFRRGAGHTMDAIVTSVQCVTDIVGHLQQMAQRGDPAAAGGGVAAPLAVKTSVELSVEMSVEQLDRMTLQNVLLANKSSATAQSLQVQAERLQKVVAAFRLLQHTQEAAWTAHSAIAGARRSSLHGLGAVRFGQSGVPGLRNSSSED